MRSSRILIVEDEGIAAMNLEAKLQELGYETAGIAFTGEQAVQMAEKNSPDLVLMDIQLQGEMNGITAAQQIQTRLDVPVIFVTAYSDDSIIKAAKKSFPYGFLVKPIRDNSIKPSVEMAIEKHRLEKELSLSQRRYETLFYQTPVGAALINGENKIVNANPALAAALGVARPSDLEGQDILHFLDVDYVSTFRAVSSKLGPVQSAQRPIEILMKLPGANGRPFWMSVVSASVQEPKSGERLGLFLFSDISAQKNVEKGLRKKAASLAMSNTELENFATFAAEDLQTPTRKIVNLLDRLRIEYSSKSPFARGRILVDLEHEVNHLKGLVSDLHNFAKACPAPKELKRVPLLRVFQDAMEELKESIAASRARVSSHYLPTVFGDERQLRRLMTNLLSNSLKFTNGTPVISVGFEETDSQFIVSLEDHGIGILPEDIPHIFEIFNRGQGGREYAGSGIGLASCRKIMENIGGKISVKSEVGKGSTFILEFPKKLPDAGYVI